MATAKGAGFDEESAINGSNSAVLNLGSPSRSMGETEKIPLIASSAAVQEGSLEDLLEDPLYRREKIKRPLKRYRAITVTNTIGDHHSNGSDDVQNCSTDQKTGRCPTFVTLYHTYKNTAITFRNSKFLYIFLFLTALLPISAIVMGSKYNESCPDSPNLSLLTILTGMFGIILVTQWFALRCCQPDERPCDDQQKIFVILFSIVALSLMGYEMHLYSKMSPSYDPTDKNYCSKTFYKYTYCRLILTVISIVFGVLIYFPGCYSFIRSIRCSMPLVAQVSCINPETEDSD